MNSFYGFALLIALFCAIFGMVSSAAGFKETIIIFAGALAMTGLFDLAIHLIKV